MWRPTVYFCDPWPWAFGLLGLSGLDPFLVTINAYDEWSELKPRATAGRGRSDDDRRRRYR